MLACSGMRTGPFASTVIVCGVTVPGYLTVISQPPADSWHHGLQREIGLPETMEAAGHANPDMTLL
jgi:hypothetical protein